MSNGDVQREVKMLKTLEKIEEHLATLVSLALANGLASSSDRSEAHKERSEIKDAVDKL